MSRNIKEFCKPMHSEVRARCPTISQTAVRAAQKELDELLSKSKQQLGKKRGPYQEISEANRAKFAAESGVSACLQHFKRTGEFTDLKESTVRGWMNAYKKEMSRITESLNNKPATVSVLPSKF